MRRVETRALQHARRRRVPGSRCAGMPSRGRLDRDGVRRQRCDLLEAGERIVLAGAAGALPGDVALDVLGEQQPAER